MNLLKVKNHPFRCKHPKYAKSLSFESIQSIIYMKGQTTIILKKCFFNSTNIRSLSSNRMKNIIPSNYHFALTKTMIQGQISFLQITSPCLIARTERTVYRMWFVTLTISNFKLGGRAVLGSNLLFIHQSNYLLLLKLRFASKLSKSKS